MPIARTTGDFAALVVHDLKDPLRRIDLAAELLQEGPDLHEARALLETLRADVRHASRLVDAVFLSLRDGPQGMVDWTVLRQQLSGLIDIPSGFQVVWEDPLPEAGSPLELRVVLRNLIANGIEHHDREQGVVMVRGAGDLIEVIDDGPGPNGGATPAPGRGLGLDLVRRLVTRRGGSFIIEGAAPRGTRVAFSWPRPLALVDAR